MILILILIIIIAYNLIEDLNSLLRMTEQQYRFWNSMHVVIRKLLPFCVITLCVRKVIIICVERLLHSALKILLHFASMLLYFAAILITFCGDYYILRRNSPSSDFIWRGTTARDFVARGRPLRGQKRLAPLAKRSTCSKSTCCSVAWILATPLNEELALRLR